MLAEDSRLDAEITHLELSQDGKQEECIGVSV